MCFCFVLGYVCELFSELVGFLSLLSSSSSSLHFACYLFFGEMVISRLVSNYLH